MHTFTLIGGGEFFSRPVDLRTLILEPTAKPTAGDAWWLRLCGCSVLSTCQLDVLVSDPGIKSKLQQSRMFWLRVQLRLERAEEELSRLRAHAKMRPACTGAQPPQKTQDP